MLGGIIFQFGTCLNSTSHRSVTPYHPTHSGNDGILRPRHRIPCALRQRPSRPTPYSNKGSTRPSTRDQAHDICGSILHAGFGYPVCIQLHTAFLNRSDSLSNANSSIYRIIELASGWHSDFMLNELYFNVLDGAMVALATFAINLQHPGRLLGSRETTLSAEYGMKSSSGSNLADGSE